MVAILLVGLLCLSALKRDLIPPFEFNNITVNIYMPGGSSEDIERLITYPVEQTLRSLPGIDKVTSHSSQDTSNITVAFEGGNANLSEMVKEVESKIASIRTQLPDSIESINVSEDKVTEVFAGYLSLIGFEAQNVEHIKFVTAIERDILNISGVVRASADSSDLNLYIDLDSKKLKYHEVSVEQIRSVLQTALSYAPIGQLTTTAKDFMVRVSNVSSDVEKIKRLPIKANSAGQTIFLDDVANVNFRTGTANYVSRVDGQSATSIYVRKDTFSDSFVVEAAMDKKIAAWNEKLPPDLHLKKMMSGAHFVRQQISVLNKNALTGFLLVLLILMFFLNVRVALMTAVGVPLAYLGTAIVLKLCGISIDLISLIGMILVIGILVDDAIILAERYTRLRAHGALPFVAAKKAVDDLIVPVTGTILTTCVAFSPILFLHSEISTILAAIPVVLISALLFSWFETFFILPNHLMHFVKNPIKENKYALGIMSYLEKKYISSLKIFIRFSVLSTIFLISIFALSVYIATKKLGQNFQLSISPERVTVFAHLKGEPSIKEAVAWAQKIESEILKFPKNEVETVVTHIGSIWESGKSYRGNRYIKINVNFPSTTNYPTKLKETLQKKIEPLLEIYKVETEKLYVDFEKEGEERESDSLLQIYVRGNESLDFNTLESLLVRDVTSVKGITEYVSDSDSIQETWEFQPDYAEIAQASSSTFNILSHLKSLLVADKIAEVRIEGEPVRVYTTVDHDKEHTYESLNDIRILNSYGVEVPAKLFGTWEKKYALKTIYHSNSERELRFSFKLDKDIPRDSLQKLVSEKTDVLQKANPDYRFEVEGISEQEKKNRSWALKVVITCMLLVFFVLAVTLGNITQPLLVSLPIPFGFIGSILALYSHGHQLSLMAMIGLVGMVGVSVNVSIVMVDQINKIQKSLNTTSLDTIIDGATSRLRPILLTTLTTLGGLVPMAYSWGGESGFTKPLAFTMGWGLFISGILTMYYLPMFLHLRQRALNRFIVKPASKDHVAATAVTKLEDLNF